MLYTLGKFFLNQSKQSLCDFMSKVCATEDHKQSGKNTNVTEFKKINQNTKEENTL